LYFYKKLLIDSSKITTKREIGLKVTHSNIFADQICTCYVVVEAFHVRDYSSIVALESINKIKDRNNKIKEPPSVYGLVSAYFLISSPFSNRRRHVIHTIGTNVRCIRKIDRSPPMNPSRRFFPSPYIKLNNLFLDRNLCR
jgi:hypothetical protein